MALLSVAADGLTTAQYAEQVAKELERRMREDVVHLTVMELERDIRERLYKQVREEVEKYTISQLRYNHRMLSGENSIDVVLSYKEGLCSTMD